MFLLENVKSSDFNTILCLIVNVKHDDLMLFVKLVNQKFFLIQ